MSVEMAAVLVLPQVGTNDSLPVNAVIRTAITNIETSLLLGDAIVQYNRLQQD